MSKKADEKMKTDSKKEEEKEKEKQKDESEGEGDDEEEEDEEEDTPKKRSSMTLAEKRLSRLSSGMEMRGMMTESYPCKECNASFSRKSKLDYHIATTHPKEVPVPTEERSPSKRGRKPKTPKKNEKADKPPKTATPEVKEKKAESVHQAEVQRAIQKQLLQQQQQHQMLQQQQQQLQQLQHEQQQQPPAIVFQNRQQSKLPKVTNISNEKVKYNWGYYCTACDMYFANMFAQQFHCLHGQAKFRCEACCICFKLRKNFMSHVQMVHGVDIPEEVLARMRPRSEIRAKQEADAEKNGQKKQDSETVDLTKDDENSSGEKDSGKDSGKAKPEAETCKLKSDETDSASSKTEQSESEKHASENGEKGTGKLDMSDDKHSSTEQNKNEERKGESEKSKDNKTEEAEIICISDDSSAKKSKVLQPKAVSDIKQTESGGNSSADEGDCKKDEGRVYLTTVRMGNTYVTLPSGEKWMIECLRCHQAFFKMEDASVHMKQRPGSHFSCPHCHYSSTLFSQCDYEIHRLRTHSFPCAQCRQSFILECQRDMHEQKIHNYFRHLMRRKTPVSGSGKTAPPAPQVKAGGGISSSGGNRTVVLTNQGGSSGKSIGKPSINRDGYPVVRTQRTPYVCLMCDRDCYTRDALEHHKKSFHSAVYRPNNKITHPISKRSISFKTTCYSGPGAGRSAPVSKILQEMRQSPNRTIAAMQDPYLEPNKIPHAYISRIKVDLPDANKLVDTIRNELLKGPSNFSMPNYAKPSKFNKDMVTNPAVVKLSREVAYKLYFDLQGPCNESDKMNYKEPDKILYKIPMGCHSQKLKDVPLFPTLEDLVFRTQNYTVPPLNTIAPVELFAGFKGDLSMKDSVSFSQELDNCMFGCFTKTMRALTMIYSSRRVAVSEGFWRLQTKALIAILKEVEEQRKKEINDRAKAASVAARAAAAAAASARPLKIKEYTQSEPYGQLPNGGAAEQPSEGQPMIQLVGNQASAKAAGTSDAAVPEAVMINLANSPTKALPQATPSDGVNSTELADQTNAESSKASSTSSDTPQIPTLRALAKRAADKKDRKQEEEKMEVEKAAEEEKEEEEGEEEGDEPKKKKRKTENGNDEDRVLVNGSASPPPGDGDGLALNGTQNGPSEGGSPANGTASSESKVGQSSITDASQKGTKLSSSEGTTTSPTEQVNSLPNGTVHTQLNRGSIHTPVNGTTLNGGTVHTQINGSTTNAPLNGGTAPVVSGNGVLNLSMSNGVGVLNGIPVQIGIKTSGNVGGNSLGNGVLQLGNATYSGGSIGTTVAGIGGVGNGFVGGGGGVGGGGNGLLVRVPASSVQLMPMQKLAYSVGAVSAVASVQNIPPIQMAQGPITFTVRSNATPLLAKPILPNPTTITIPPVTKPTIAKLIQINPQNTKSTVTKMGNGVIPEKISKFISRNFVNIKPKQPGAKLIPIKVDSLPFFKVNTAPNVAADPKVDELLKVCKLTSPNGQSINDTKEEGKQEDFVLTRVLQSMAIIKQLQSSKFLPEELCKKITPLCEKIVLSSTTMEDKEDLSREVDAILKAEAKDALKLFSETKDLNDNNNSQSSHGDGESGDAKAIDQFLHSLAKRIRYIQSRLTARSIDPVSMAEIVPLCQDICNPKLTLTWKVRCIRDIEDRIQTYEAETCSQSQAATPVDIAAVPQEVEVDEDACVYFKLQLEDGNSVMVNMNDLEDSFQAISDLGRLAIGVKRLSSSDIKTEKRKVKRRKIMKDEKKASPEPTQKETSKASSKATSKATSKAVSDATSKAASKATPKATSKAASEPTQKATSKASSEATSKVISKAASKATSKANSEPTSKATSKATSEATSNPTPKASPKASLKVASSSSGKKAEEKKVPQTAKEKLEDKVAQTQRKEPRTIQLAVKSKELLMKKTGEGKKQDEEQKQKTAKPVRLAIDSAKMGKKSDVSRPIELSVTNKRKSPRRDSNISKKDK